MQQQQRADADYRAPRPLGAWPVDPVRPTTVAGSLAAAFAIGIVPTGISMIAAEPGQVGAGIVLWVILSVGVALPVGLLVGLVGWRAERVLVGRTSARPGQWAPWGVGIALAAHWAPLCLWTPLLVLEGMARPSSADEYLGQAVLSLVSWVAVGGGAGLVLVAHRLAHGERVRVGSPPPYKPSRIPTSVPIAAASAMIAVLPAGLWLVWLEGAWSSGAGTVGVAAWALLTGGGAVLAGWLTGAVCIGATGISPALGSGVRARQVEVVGAVIAGVWAASFLNALALPVRLAGGQVSDDLRFSVLFSAVAAVGLGVALWSFARTVRTAADPSVGAGQPRAVPR
jgi:hypothetical protein